VTLVEVLIVVAIMATIAGAVTMVAIPEYNRSRVKVAAMSAAAIREAAQAYRAIEDAAPDACPTVQDLVQARKIDARRADDPWGSTFKIECEGEDIRVISPGRDRKLGTSDDVRDGMKPAEIELASRG
jgi:general secretion pathway protein G